MDPAISGLTAQKPPAAKPAARSPQDIVLMEKAKELEASFLSEMLGHAGLDTPSESFGGGIGEDQFSSLLRDEQAKAMVKKGGIGLAEHLFRALSARANAANSAADQVSHAE